MDPRKNPYAPGAGSPPPELAGRTDLIERASISLDRIRANRSAKSQLLVGLRGVGKTVLLNRIRLDAESTGICCVDFEVPEDRSLLALLLPHLRLALLKLDKERQVRDKVKRAWQAIAGLLNTVKLKHGEFEFGLDVAAEPGVADSGDLGSDLSDLLVALGQAAMEINTAIAVFADELQYADETELAALIYGLHKCASVPSRYVGRGGVAPTDWKDRQGEIVR